MPKWTSSNPCGCNSGGAPGPAGPTGLNGATGAAGAAGADGITGGLVFYLDTIDGTATIGNPIIADLLLTPNNGTQTTINYTTDGASPNVLVGTFTTEVGALISTLIPTGLWDLNIYAATNIIDANAPYFYYKIFKVDADGSSNPILIVDGSTHPVLITNTQDSQIIYDLPICL